MFTLVENVSQGPIRAALRNQKLMWAACGCGSHGVPQGRGRNRSRSRNTRATATGTGTSETPKCSSESAHSNPGISSGCFCRLRSLQSTTATNATRNECTSRRKVNERERVEDEESIVEKQSWKLQLLTRVESSRVQSRQMTAAQQFGDPPSSHYEYRYSPPVSPRSQPHGYKRKASTQEDDLESQSLISNSFKKLRLSKSARTATTTTATARDHVLNTVSDNAKRPSATVISPVGVSCRAAIPVTSPSDPQSALLSHARHDEEDFMPIDETADRIWVHDLDAEIAEIEADEARERERIQLSLSEAGSQYAKIPDHLLKLNNQADPPASNMQMVLYRDPISLSVPEENDAVRKTVAEARRRMRENQLGQSGKVLPPVSGPEMAYFLDRMQQPSTADGDIDMDLD